MISLIALSGFGFWVALLCWRHTAEAFRSAAWGYEDGRGFHLGVPTLPIGKV